MNKNIPLYREAQGIIKTNRAGMQILASGMINFVSIGKGIGMVGP